jgi:hypothetical protein
MTLTAFQEQCLTIIENELKANPAYAAWMKPSYVMALIQEESNWNKDVPSSDGLGSIGLMQPLPATVAEAKAAGVQAGSMHDPQSNIRVGLWCFESKRKYLHAHEFTPNSRGLMLGRAVKLEDVVAAYNEGEGNVLKGRPDQPYVDRFHRYQSMYAFVDQVMDGHPVSAVPLAGDVAAAPEAVEPEPAPAPEPVVVREAPKDAAEAASWWPHIDWSVLSKDIDALKASPAAPTAPTAPTAESEPAPPAADPNSDASADALNAAEADQPGVDPVVAAAQAAVKATRKSQGK